MSIKNPAVIVRLSQAATALNKVFLTLRFVILA